MRNVKSIKPVSVQEVKSLKEVKNIYALTEKQAEALKKITREHLEYRD